MEKAAEFVPEVNYAKSIVKGKIVYNRKGWWRYGYFFYMSTIALLFIGMLLASIIEAYNSNYTLLPLTILTISYLLINLRFANAFVIIKGKYITVNKEDAINTLKNMYEDLTFNASLENILRDVSVQGSFATGRCLTVLFYDDMVYFHKATLSRALINPFTGLFFDYYKSKQIAESFKSLQNKKGLKTAE